MHFAKFVALLSTLFATLVAVGADAAMPVTSSVEGALLSSAGPAADGNYQVAFALYGAASGGSAVWNEGPVLLAVKNGVFSWQLGSKTPLSPAVLSMATPFVGVQVGTDPELPRQPLAAAPYAHRAAVAENVDCSGCIKGAALDGTVLQAYAKTADLGNFAKASDLGAYAKSVDLADYVKAAALAKVAASGEWSDLKNPPKLADVAATGAYGDLTDKPVLAQLGKACGTGLVVNGLKADGSLDCGPVQLPPDGIDEISNGLIFNQFVDKVPGSVDVPIPDGIGSGKSDAIDFPDIGVAQAIWIDVDVLNSDVSALTIELFGPGMASPYILYSKGAVGQTIKTSFNKDTKIAGGDMNKDWVGKNIKGSWSITVKDPLKNQLNATTDGKFAWGIGIQTLSNKKIQVKGNAIIDGNLWLGKLASGSGLCGNGLLEVGEQCDDGNSADGDGCSSLCSASGALASCAAILAKNAGAKTGKYTVDIDGSGPYPPRSVICDMTSDGGGWTRFIYHNDWDGMTRMGVDSWNHGITFAASAGIKQWLVKTYLNGNENTEVGTKPHNAWVLNLNASYQGRGFSAFVHATNLAYNTHRWQGPARVDSAKILAGSNCTSWNASYNNGAYLWGEHRWQDNFSLGWMWMSHCGSPSYHMLIINHDYDYGANQGRGQTLVGTDTSPGGANSNYDEDGGGFEFFFK